MRLLSLCPSTTLSLFQLGVGNRLVGVTRYCVHPAEAVASIEKVGGTKNPKLARILELGPDLVFLNREENRREDWEALQAAGIACHLSYPRTVHQVIQTVLDFGQVLGVTDSAAQLVDEIVVARDHARKQVPTYDLSWVYLIWRKPWMAVNNETYISSLICEAGGRNALAHRQQTYPEVSAAELSECDPDLVLLSSEPFPFKSKHIDELAMATGLPASRFRLVDGELLSWHGSFTARGLEYASGLIGIRGVGN